MALKICPECGQEFNTLGLDGRDHPGKRFCSEVEKHRWHNRNQKRGKAVLALLMVSKDRKADPDMVRYARRNADQLVRAWLRQDRDAGRLPELIVQDRMGEDWRAIDHDDALDVRVA